MNTTSIGNAYEDRVFSYFSSLIQQEDIPSLQKHSKLFKHKKYQCTAYSREIDTDISIETYNPIANSAGWSSLIIIECKCYNHTVDISDYDEFCKKLDYISEYGIKGIMVTTKGFSSTTIEMARKMHIGLVVMSDERIDWLVSRDINVESEHLMTILRGENSLGRIPIVYNNGTFLHTIDLLDNYGAATSVKNLVTIPFLTAEAIKVIVNNLLSSFTIQPQDISGEVWARFFPDYRIGFENMGNRVYAKLDPARKLLWLSNDLINDEHRRNFSLAHEIGHLCLHLSLFLHLGVYVEGQASDYYHYLSETMQKRMEYQANTFASFLLMPDKWFLPSIRCLFQKYSITTGKLYLDNQPCNINDVRLITSELSKQFSVSIQAVKIRLKNSSLLIEDKSHQPNRIRNLF